MNPWDIVAEKRKAYNAACAAENYAHDFYVSHVTQEACRAWQASMRANGVAFWEHANARREALKSGVLMPCDGQENC